MEELYKDRKRIINTITSMYKFIFSSEKKQIWEKSANDIQDDVMSAKYNLDLDKIVKESYADILNAESRTKLIQKKTQMIPALLDFCYVYYVKFYNGEAPFYKVPMSKLKLRFILSTLKANNETINGLFEKIIEDKFLAELRQEIPPYYLRTELSIDEIKEKLENDAKPICKQLLEQLYRLPDVDAVNTTADNDVAVNNIDNADTTDTNFKIIQDTYDGNFKMTIESRSDNVMIEE